MLARLLLLTVLIGFLTGCAVNELYQPYRLRHPGTGATVTCGYWVWWECMLFDYEKHGYARVQKDN